MSKYTTEVRFICETSAGRAEQGEYSDIGSILHECHNDIIGSYPIFDETYREVLNTKILKHYYTREICEETVGLWKLRLNTRMNEIMPYYNKLYRSELLDFNPFYDVDLETQSGKSGLSAGTSNSEIVGNKNDTRTGINQLNREESHSTDGSNSNETHSGTNANSKSVDNRIQKDRYSDTPQGALNNFEDNLYLTNARIIDGEESNIQKNNQSTDAYGNGSYGESGSNSENTTSSVNEGLDSRTKQNSKNVNTINTTEDYLERVRGKRGGHSYAKLLMEYRESFLNIDKLIIDNLSDLFFGLW